MLFKDKNGNYTSDYLLDSEVNEEMQDKSNKHEIKAFDNCDIENNEMDFWGKDKDKEKDIDNFVNKLFSNDPFDDENNIEVYEGFDPDKIDKNNPFIEMQEDDKIIADLEELREITKNTFEKFKNKIIKEL